MSPLTQDTFSPQARFENAVEVLKLLAGKSDSESLSNDDRATDMFGRPSGGRAVLDRADITQASGEEAFESDLRNILDVFEFSVEECELAEETCLDKRVVADPDVASGLPLRKGFSKAERTSPASLDGLPDRKYLPSLKGIIGMIAVAEISAAVALTFALASWLSVGRLDSPREALEKNSFAQSSSTRSAMIDAASHNVAASIPGDLRMSGFAVEALATFPGPRPTRVDPADIKDYSAARESNPTMATRFAVAGYPIRAVSARPVAVHLSPALPVDETRSARQSGADAVEHPQSTSAQNLTIQSTGVELPSSPEGWLRRPVSLLELSGTPMLEANLASSIAARSLKLPAAIMNGSVEADLPDTSDPKAEEAFHSDRAKAKIPNLAILQDLRQELRLRAVREWQTKLVLSQEAMRQSDRQILAVTSQKVSRDLLASYSEPVPADTPPRDRRLAHRAELLVRNAELLLRRSAINGASLLLERPAADGNIRTPTY